MVFWRVISEFLFAGFSSWKLCFIVIVIIVVVVIVIVVIVELTIDTSHRLIFKNFWNLERGAYIFWSFEPDYTDTWIDD